MPLYFSLTLSSGVEVTHGLMVVTVIPEAIVDKKDDKRVFIS